MNSRTNYKLQTLQRMARKGSDWLDLSDKWRNSDLVQGLVDETWLTHARVCVCVNTLHVVMMMEGLY